MRGKERDEDTTDVGWEGERSTCRLSDSLLWQHTFWLAIRQANSWGRARAPREGGTDRRGPYSRWFILSTELLFPVCLLLYLLLGSKETLKGRKLARRFGSEKNRKARGRKQTAWPNKRPCRMAACCGLWRSCHSSWFSSWCCCCCWSFCLEISRCNKKYQNKSSAHPVSSSSIKRQPVIDVCLGYTDKYTGCLLEFKGRIVAVVV